MQTPPLDKPNIALTTIPQAYNYMIRLKSASKYLSWLFINLLPTSFYAIIPHVIEQKSIPLQVLSAFLLMAFGMHYLYEFGYIYNDTISIRKENNPSIRLTESQLSFTTKNLKTIFALRISVYALCMIATYILMPNQNTLVAIAISVINAQLFYLYNTWRSVYNAWLYLPLVASKFLPYAWLAPDNYIDISALLLFTIYPLEIGIERFSMEKYRFTIAKRIIPTEKSKQLFRAGYYLTITPLAIAIIFISSTPYLLILPYILFLIYRTTLYTLQRTKNDKTNR